MSNLPESEYPYANERQYFDLLYRILEEGEIKTSRTGTDTLSIFHSHCQYDLNYSFPILTSKKIYWKGIVGELLWFLRGETNIKSLQDDNIHIWDEWADENGDLGPVYGYQWRNFPRVDWDDGDPSLAGSVDQIEQLVTGLKENRNDRRHIVCAWNPGMRHDMALPPCHAFVQFYVRQNKYLDCQLYQRSADTFLGVPFNIASYALLLSIIALKVDLEPGILHHTLGDAHLYVNHLDAVDTQTHRRRMFPAPKLVIDPVVKDLDWDDMKIEHFTLDNYISEPALKGIIAV